MPRTIPSMPDDWKGTRTTLHAWARAIGEVTRAHAPPQRNWWHLGLEPTGSTLRSRAIPAEGGVVVRLAIDLDEHSVTVRAGDDEHTRVEVSAGSDREAIEPLFDAVGDLGLDVGEIDRSRLLDGGGRYDTAAAGVFRHALRKVSGLFAEHRESLEGDVGPILLWPHGFDLAFEWFGTRTVTDPETDVEARAQLNLGWVPGPDPYFFSNPWPFDPELTEHPLPHGAVWHTEGWKGTRLDHDLVSGSDAGGRRLLEYAAAVHRIATPTLTT